MTRVERILVPLDLTGSNAHVISSARNLAAQHAAELHILHVVRRSVLSRESTPESEHDALELLKSLINSPAEIAGVTCGLRYIVRDGSPAREIVRYARESGAGMIVMGTHGRTGLSHMVLGSVSEAVLRNASCPVVVVRAADFEEPAPEDDRELNEKLAHLPSGGLENVIESNRVLELLQHATACRATDVHIDPDGADRVRIRFRVDGKLRTFCRLDQHIASPLLMQMKLMADFSNTQSFEPQEGRLKLPASSGGLEVRVTLVPACGGDAVSMRLLNHDVLPRPLSMLGMSAVTDATVKQMLHHREGLVLVTGPTGVGKTTTVYGMLQLLDTGDRNIVSIEDPVEYHVPSIRQLSVSPRHNLTMTRGLKSLLRMDPDVVFIGEIRDLETLDMTMRASSSGRYVFSTLHTRDVASTVTALRDLHADNYSLAGNLTGIVCQRLVRVLCRGCRQLVPITDEQRQVFLAEQIAPPSDLYVAQGCALCQDSGYRERIGVFEAVLADGEVVAAIQNGAPEDELRRVIRTAGVPSLAADVLAKVRDGITSLDEARSMGWA